jgi:hypothetical protein
MSQEEPFHSCVGKLYEIPLEPQGWGAFLDDFCSLIDAAFAHYVAWDERSDATVFSASSRAIATGSEQAYITGRWARCGSLDHGMASAENLPWLRQIVKNRFGFRKTRYRGIAKNHSHLHTLFMLANLVIAKKKLQHLHALNPS